MRTKTVRKRKKISRTSNKQSVQKGRKNGEKCLDEIQV